MIKLYFYVWSWNFDDATGEYREEDILASTTEPDDTSKVVVGTGECYLHEFSREGITAKRLEKLREAKEIAQKEFITQLQNFDNQIDRLLAITHQPSNAEGEYISVDD